MNAPLWQPGPERVANARITAFTERIRGRYGLALPDYAALHRWSIDERAAFWSELWDYCDVVCSRGCDTVLEHGEQLPGARWFVGSRLNYAQNLLRFRDERPALVALSEDGGRRVLTYAALYLEVERLAAALRAHGVQAGDRVAAILPNIPEAIIAMLASASIGAVWSCCSPDFGASGIMDRFGQIGPRLLFAADGYVYQGKAIDIRERLADIADRIPAIERVIVVPVLAQDADLGAIRASVPYDAFCRMAAPAPLAFAQLPFDQPLFILYSSGTTGAPKCILHGAGGTLLQHLKEHQLHTDIRREDVLFYFTTCGWMMWNWLASGLASGCTLVLYDGSPMARDGSRLLDAIDDENITVFGASAGYLGALKKSGLQPRRSHRLDSLQTLLSTGSPLSAECFAWVYEAFKPDLLLASISGGTDIISCFVLGNPTLPVYAGEIQCPGLGMAVEIRDERGDSLRQRKGELVCTRAFPSCPLGFWNDPDGSRFRRAYFERFAGAWAHGDYGEITSHGGMIIHGRSDAVLNPGGVRIGTAEIYRQLEAIEAVTDALVIGQEWQGDTRIVLFVVLRQGLALDDDLRRRIAERMRRHASPRHVPARIVQVSAIPRTISGKIVELAVREVVHGRPVGNRDALANPEALEQFRDRPELEI